MGFRVYGIQVLGFQYPPQSYLLRSGFRDQGLGFEVQGMDTQTGGLSKQGLFMANIHGGGYIRQRCMRSRAINPQSWLGRSVWASMLAWERILKQVFTGPRV